MHVHPGNAELDTRRMTSVLQASVAVTLAFVALELVGGYYARSIGLISDAFHNLTDVPTLLLSWFALYMERKPPTAEKTFGYHRAGVLAAFGNALVLIVVGGFIFYEAIERLRHPLVVGADLMLAVSCAGLLVNGGISLALARGRRDLNLRSVFIHNLGDAASSLGLILASLLIRFTGFFWIDPAIGMAIGAGILWSSWSILKETVNILLEGLPKGMTLKDVAEAVLSVPGVQEVHDMHIWSLGSRMRALSCHVRIRDMNVSETETLRQQINSILEHMFHIDHTTIQFEPTVTDGPFMPAPLAAGPARMQSERDPIRES
jgi:cobalt-zinc-cadmium efflux system protein